MSDQSLREALEQKLATTDGWTVSNEFLLGLLAAHPAEPAPVVTDEAVRKAAWVFAEQKSQAWLTFSDETRTRIAASWEPTARAALEAAAPLLGPRPLLDETAIRDVFVRFWNAVLCNSDVPGWTVQQEAEKARDAVMELARPMPTFDEITDAIDGALDGPAEDPVPVQKLAKAVLALLDGAES